MLANSSECGARALWEGCFITLLMSHYPKFRHFWMAKGHRTHTTTLLGWRSSFQLCFTETRQTACRVWVCTGCELTFPPAGPCQYKDDVFIPSLWKGGVGQPICTGVFPLHYWLFLPTWLGVPGPSVLPQTPHPWAQTPPHQLCHASMLKLGRRRQGQAAGQGRAGAGRAAGRQHSLAAGGVHQQRDEGGGSRADAVQRQHGVFALLFADDVI